VEPSERPDDAAGLLDDLMIALLDLPGEEWFDLADRLPGALVERVCDYIERAPAIMIGCGSTSCWALPERRPQPVKAARLPSTAERVIISEGGLS
jgi:hypothetical protein